MFVTVCSIQLHKLGDSDCLCFGLVQTSGMRSAFCDLLEVSCIGCMILELWGFCALSEFVLWGICTFRVTVVGCLAFVRVLCDLCALSGFVLCDLCTLSGFVLCDLCTLSGFVLCDLCTLSEFVLWTIPYCRILAFGCRLLALRCFWQLSDLFWQLSNSFGIWYWMVLLLFHLFWFCSVLPLQNFGESAMRAELF